MEWQNYDKINFFTTDHICADLRQLQVQNSKFYMWRIHIGLRIIFLRLEIAHPSCHAYQRFAPSCHQLHNVNSFLCHYNMTNLIILKMKMYDCQYHQVE